jgi:hypothetical protein
VCVCAARLFARRACLIFFPTEFYFLHNSTAIYFLFFVFCRLAARDVRAVCMFVKETNVVWLLLSLRRDCGDTATAACSDCCLLYFSCITDIAYCCMLCGSSFPSAAIAAT